MGDEVSHVVNKPKKLLDRFLSGKFVREVKDGGRDVGLESILSIMKVHAYEINFFLANLHFSL